MRAPFASYLIALPCFVIACGGGDSTTGDSHSGADSSVGGTQDGVGGRASGGASGGVSSGGRIAAGGTSSGGASSTGGAGASGSSGGVGGDSDASAGGSSSTGGNGAGGNVSGDGAVDAGGVDAGDASTDGSAAVDAASGDGSFGGTGNADAGGVDGGSAGGNGGSGGSSVACPYSGPPLVQPSQFPSCNAATCSLAHCAPAGTVPAAEQALLAPCAGGGFCTPDSDIAAQGQVVPTSCTSIAGAEGRCLSTCLPAVAARAALLQQSTCSTGSRCAPCYDPLSATPDSPTGFCSLGCDAPQKPPVVLACPYTGPDVVNPAAFPSCGPASSSCRCVPGALLAGADAVGLATCSQGLCVPNESIKTAGNYVPASCAPYPDVMSDGSQGRCLSTCLPTVASQATLQRSSCDASHKCAPCFDPMTGNPTGACTLSCDAPPATKFVFPSCGNSIGTCVPLSMLAGGGYDASNDPQDTCPSANYRCVPDEWLPGNTPLTCTNGLGQAGACIPKYVQSSPVFGQGTCPSNAYVCVACMLAPAGTPGCG